jgi:hypothetical protein
MPCPDLVGGNTMNPFVVVTRHPALVELLEERGLIPEGTPVKAHATADDVRNMHVIGVLPLSLAAEAASVTEIPLSLTPELRGKELDLATLRQIAGEEVTYHVSISQSKTLLAEAGLACPYCGRVDCVSYTHGDPVCG